jgi:hypothetical protein
MLFEETVAVYCENQAGSFYYVKEIGTHSNHWALKSKIHFSIILLSTGMSSKWPLWFRCPAMCVSAIPLDFVGSYEAPRLKVPCFVPPVPKHCQSLLFT